MEEPVCPWGWSASHTGTGAGSGGIRPNRLELKLPWGKEGTPHLPDSPCDDGILLSLRPTTVVRPVSTAGPPHSTSVPWTPESKGQFVKKFRGLLPLRLKGQRTANALLFWGSRLISRTTGQAVGVSLAPGQGLSSFASNVPSFPMEHH